MAHLSFWPLRLADTDCVKICGDKGDSTMGRVVIELPLQVDRHFHITDAKVAAKVLRQLESLTQAAPTARNRRTRSPPSSAMGTNNTANSLIDIDVFSRIFTVE
jgi:hypothetical protein